jgi:hypothetical protein
MKQLKINPKKQEEKENTGTENNKMISIQNY